MDGPKPEFLQNKMQGIIPEAINQMGDNPIHFLTIKFKIIEMDYLRTQ